MPKFTDLPDPDHWFLIGVCLVCWGIAFLAYKLGKK
jgi:uncharacterized protein (DUF486 family)